MLTYPDARIEVRVLFSMTRTATKEEVWQLLTIMDNHPNRVDPGKWKPLIMSFQEFYTLGDKVHESTLAEIPENLYNIYDSKSTQAEV